MGQGRGKKRKMKKLERGCTPDNLQEKVTNIEIVSKQIELAISALKANTGIPSVILEENIDNVEYYGIDQSDTGSQV